VSGDEAWLVVSTYTPASTANTIAKGARLVLVRRLLEAGVTANSDTEGEGAGTVRRRATLRQTTHRGCVCRRAARDALQLDALRDAASASSHGPADQRNANGYRADSDVASPLDIGEPHDCRRGSVRVGVVSPAPWDEAEAAVSERSS